jgi:hypothetical protein
MRRPRTMPLAVLAALCAGGALAPAAGAQDVPGTILADFREDRRVAPCEHTAAEVRQALDELPADADVLTPDLREQLEASAEAHTSGRCRRGAGVASEDDAATGAEAGGGAGALEAQRATEEAVKAAKDRPLGSPDQVNLTPQPPPPNAEAPAAQDDAIARAAQADPARTAAGDAPAPLWLLLACAAAFLVAVLAWLALRATGREAPGLAGGRHGRREAAWRASNAWADFTDWVRLGR